MVFIGKASVCWIWLQILSDDALQNETNLTESTILLLQWFLLAALSLPLCTLLSQISLSITYGGMPPLLIEFVQVFTIMTLHMDAICKSVLALRGNTRKQVLRNISRWDCIPFNFALLCFYIMLSHTFHIIIAWLLYLLLQSANFT